MELSAQKMIRNWVILILFLASAVQACGQWLSPSDFRNAKKIMLVFEVPDGSFFRNVPDIDTTLLKLNQAFYNGDKKVTESLIEVIAKPYNNGRYNKSIPADSLSSEQKQNFEKLRDRENERLADLVSGKLSASRDILAFPRRYRFLNAFNDSLNNVLNQMLFKDSLTTNPILFELYSQLKLPDSSRFRLLQFKDLSERSKAKIGDKMSEKKIIDEFLTQIRDSLIDIEAFENAAEALLIVESPATMEVFFNALESSSALYQSIGVQDNVDYYKVYSVPFLLLQVYDRINYFELRYFEKYIYNNQTINRSMWPIIYFNCVEIYLSKKYKRDININAFFDMRILNYPRK